MALLCSAATHFMGCISVQDLAASIHPVLTIPLISPWNGVSAFFIPIIGTFWGWFNSCFAFLKLASLFCRVVVALGRKYPLGQVVPSLCSLELPPSCFSFPSDYTATDSTVKMLYSLQIPIRNKSQNLGDIFSVPGSHLCFLFYFYSYFYCMTFFNIAKIICVCLWYIPLSTEYFEWLICYAHSGFELAKQLSYCWHMRTWIVARC